MSLQAQSGETGFASAGPQQRPDERGKTIADALRFLGHALYVYVAVPGGYGDWNFCRVSKSEARRFLTASYKKPDDAFASSLTWSKFDARPSLFMGSVYGVPAESEAA